MENNDLGLLALVAKQVRELRDSFRALSKQAGPAGKDGRDGVNGKDGVSIRGADGKDGRNGTDGKDGKDGRDGTDGKDGERGPVGPAPKHKWVGTKLQFEKPDGSWGKAVDLKGDPGKNGSGGFVSAALSPPSTPFELDALGVASDAVPQEFIVKQDNVWVRATYEQMSTWLGGGGGVPANAVTVNGEVITADGETVTVT